MLVSDMRDGRIVAQTAPILADLCQKFGLVDMPANVEGDRPTAAFELVHGV
jgi:hypothetical protein